ncbi:hypothetical protein F5X96DRAFT_622214 [Biscogniauxia mediterranea]|nr:hypothetical protein F5X96DRAFT_622214 [Biscogniauxia mediterranea]
MHSLVSLALFGCMLSLPRQLSSPFVLALGFFPPEAHAGVPRGPGGRGITSQEMPQIEIVYHNEAHRDRGFL